MNKEAQKVLESLLEGNRRYADSLCLHPHQDEERRKKCSIGQKPKAAIIGCADSRVPPEVLFDCGIGDIFVIRIAGTVLDNSVIASIEYAVAHLNVPLIMVLGHTSCGAVTAAVKGTHTSGALEVLLDSIRKICDSDCEKNTYSIDDIIKKYTVHCCEEVRLIDPVVSNAIKNGKCSVVATCYNLETGIVELL